MLKFNIKLILVLGILAGITSCAQDPLSPIASGPSTINMTITVDNTNLNRLDSKSLNKPAEITRVTLTVSGSDIESVSRQLIKTGNNYAGSVEVQKGNNRVFRVQAFDANNFVQYEGQTTKSIQADEETVSVTMEPQYPNPVSLTIVSYTSSTVTLSWSQNNDNDFYSYLILASTSAQPNVDADGIDFVTEQNQTSYTVSGLYPNITYYFQVLVVDTELLYNGSNVASVTTKSSGPSALINDVWVDFEYWDYDINSNYKKGMLIHVNFDIDGHQGATGYLTCWFYFAGTSNTLLDKNGLYRDADGNVSVQGSFTPSYSSSNYPDYTLFMPYDELHQVPGTYQLRFSTGVFDSNLNIIAYEDKDTEQYFSFIQTSNSLQAQPKVAVK